ncbi:hypothetical protein ACJJIF_20675 [Microbulbifer sp. SSSA002]|uniref:hypothetical protein n=1 Tax=Microbulbifer sp. SSSA002 TaxID=3243376 RepID=UPI0040399BCD
MMNFNEYNQPAKTLVLYYAELLDCNIAKSIVSGGSNLSSKKEAKDLAYFFWEMTDQVVDDESEDKVIHGVSDLQAWLEKSLYIFTGYFKKQGYEREWSESYDKYHDE